MSLPKWRLVLVFNLTFILAAFDYREHSQISETFCFSNFPIFTYISSQSLELTLWATLFPFAASTLIFSKALLLACFSSHFAHSPRVISSYTWHLLPAVLKDSQISMLIQIELSRCPVWSSGVISSFSFFVVLQLSWRRIASFSLLSPKEKRGDRDEEKFLSCGRNTARDWFRSTMFDLALVSIVYVSEVFSGCVLPFKGWVTAPRKPPYSHMSPLLSPPSHSHTFSLSYLFFLCLLPSPYMWLSSHWRKHCIFEWTRDRRSFILFLL